MKLQKIRKLELLGENFSASIVTEKENEVLLRIKSNIVYDFRTTIDIKTLNNIILELQSIEADYTRILMLQSEELVEEPETPTEEPETPTEEPG